MLPGYIPLRIDDAPFLDIIKNSKYPLVKLAVLKGIHVMTNILSNMKKMGFVYHDMGKFHELDMS